MWEFGDEGDWVTGGAAGSLGFHGLAKHWMRRTADGCLGGNEHFGNYQSARAFDFCAWDGALKFGFYGVDLALGAWVEGVIGERILSETNRASTIRTTQKVQ